MEAFGEAHDVDWQLRPVVYGALLSATGLVGPVEVGSKRRYTFRDITRTAKTLGVPLVGPPEHPFRSLEALRAVCVFAEDPLAVRLVVALAHACWGEGRDLTDRSVIGEVVAGVGLAETGLGDRIADSEAKRRLREHTEGALSAGVFGVPTFRYDGELFWGNDRMGQLAAWLGGTLDGNEAGAEAMELRPRGADRRGLPMRRDWSQGPT